MRKSFKCNFNPAQMMCASDLFGMGTPIRKEVNINKIDMMKSIPAKKQGDYSEGFLKWFIDFHAERLHISDWDKLPDWMLPMLKKRAEELHEGLKFKT